MYKIKEELLNGVLHYLSTRPFNEVNELIKEIQKVEKIEEDK